MTYFSKKRLYLLAVLLAVSALTFMACDLFLNNDEDNGDNGGNGEAADYYVSPNGDDQSDGSSLQKAFRTLAKAFAALGPGDTLRVMAGTYKESIIVENVGNNQDPITIIGDDENDPPVIDGNGAESLGIWLENCKNFIFKHLKIQNFTDIGIGCLDSSHITMDGLTIFNNGFAVQLKGWELEGYGIHVDESDHITVQNCDVSQNGPNPQVPPIYMGTGINMYGCTDSLIKKNHSHHNIGGGVLVEDSVNVLVEDNDIYSNDLDATADGWWDGGIWLDGGHDVTLKNNRITDNLGPGIEISDEDFQNPYGYVLEGNVCNDNYYGIFVWNFGSNDWPPANIIKRTGNDFTGNTRQNIWILDWF